MAKRTPSGVPGTGCGVCRRSKAEEPGQFRIRRRNGREALNWCCKPCEAVLRLERKEARERGSQPCSVGGCTRPQYVSGWCQSHYDRKKRTGETGAATFRRYGSGSTCEFAGCGRPHLSGGLCGAHYQQRFNGRPLVPLRPRRDPYVRDEQGRKSCGVCEEWLPEDHYYRNARTRDGFATVCRRCNRSTGLQRKFGITLTQYEEILDRQGGGCAACGRTESANGRFLAVDHDHACCPTDETCGGCIRGLLCNPCNLLLGLAQDDTARLAALARYINRSPSGLAESA